MSHHFDLDGPKPDHPELDHLKLDHPKLDRQSFQQLLANAFAVQESHIDQRSLAVFVKIQHLIEAGDLNVPGAMGLVAQSALNVANAAGVAIGLLQGHHLIYRAGSGSAAADVDRQVTASLTASADTLGNHEILCVENADADPRIQAAICRQLGAKSLLILPICDRNTLAGVLEVRFSEAHTFEEPEVRTYRLMTGLIEEAMLRAEQVQTKQVQTKPNPADAIVAEPVEQKKILAPVAEAGVAIPAEILRNPASTPLPTGAALYQRFQRGLAKFRKSSIFKQPASMAAMLTTRAKGTAIPINGRGGRNLALAGLTVVLLFTCAIAYKGHRQASPVASSTLSQTSTNEKDETLVPLPAATTSASAPVAKPSPVRRQIKPAKSTSRPIRVANNEVDYVRGDVTVRYFTYKTAKQRKPVNKNRVAHIGDDVTVRYFAPQPTVHSVSR